ncbi:MAG: 50S ribosomal protein L28 [Candidatus Levybacteria bacterium]|nr:50S ribosomal protein L28 [Candidatus Levybacteria bacterium]
MSGNKCANCGKGVLYGHNVSHAKNRTRKLFRPNLHSARVLIGTTRRRMKLCTKCLRMFREMEKEVVAARAGKFTQASS